MTAAVIVSVLMTVVMAATPILLAAQGELVAEKAGVLNLGVEGMMLLGAVAGFAVASTSGSAALGLAAAAAAGVVASLIFVHTALVPIESNRIESNRRNAW